MPWSAGSVPGEVTSAGREEGWSWRASLYKVQLTCPGQVHQGCEVSLCSSYLQQMAPKVPLLCPPDHIVLMVHRPG